MRELKRWSIWFIIFLAFSGISLLLVVNQILNLRLFGVLFLDNTYMYIILALYLSFAFPLYPGSNSAPKNRVPWYDVLLFLLTLIICLYFATKGLDITRLGWDFTAPLLPTIFSLVLWILVLEAVRRATDIYMFSMCLVFSVFPLFSIYMPGFLQGQSYDLLTIARMYVMGRTGIIGVPLDVVCTLLIGFMVFGVVLQSTGGGTFFFKMAQSLLGHTRGGAAKISIIASAFFGMISGSTTSNTLTIGAMTIPAMKNTGFPPHYAAAIEACASTGGPIMPPVMGAGAFIMASFLNVPYAYVAIGAFIPACLYYLGLFVQVDGYAVKAGLKGLPRAELPSFWLTLKEGWFYITVIILLTYLLLTLQIEERAPFYASGAMFILSMIKKETRLTWNKIVDMVISIGKVVAMLVAILAAAGLIIGGPSVTGVALSFSGEIIALVGNNTLLILIVGAIASFVLGLGMTITACYVFLAIVMVPALIKLGIDPLAAHLFVFYWGVLSEITPPVALTVSAACGLAGSDFMKTGWTAMRLGAIKYIVPFFFVYNPALLTHGPWIDVLMHTSFAVIGTYYLASGLEGYLWGAGFLKKLPRGFLVAGGLLTAFPEIITSIIGIIVCLSVHMIGYLMARKASSNEVVQKMGHSISL
jgi:TRAP transporter 4TM/12TM fusion protein